MNSIIVSDSPVLAKRRRPSFQDLTGQTFGRLTVVREGEGKPGCRVQVHWYCICSCGNTTLSKAASLKCGTAKSCGCAQREAVIKANTTHGKHKLREYTSWSSMWDRCTNPSSSDYSRYRDRHPPEAWRSFEQFYEDMGPRPTATHTLERVDNAKGYGPDNCVWATKAEQNKNRSTTLWVRLDGEVLCLKEACERLGLPYMRTYKRYRRHDMLRASNNQFDLVKENE